MSKELPYLKFFPEQWLSGDINYLPFELQGAFTTCMAHYWANNCKMCYNKLLMRLKDEKILKQLIENGLIETNKNNINIKFLDEQYKEFIELHEKRVKNGRKGGSQTQAKIKGGLSNTQALKKDKIKKDKYDNDNLLKVSDDVKKLLSK